MPYRAVDLAYLTAKAAELRRSAAAIGQSRIAHQLLVDADAVDEMLKDARARGPDSGPWAHA